RLRRARGTRGRRRRRPKGPGGQLGDRAAGPVVSAGREGTSMILTTYAVHGMTCDHCVRAVTAELSALPGVAGVDVDLVSGAVTVSASSPIDIDAVGSAIDEAGYQLVG